MRELRLVGAVASDPRKSRSRALCDEVHVLHVNMFICGWTDRLGGGLDRQVDWMDRQRGRTGRSIYETTAVYSIYIYIHLFL